MRIDVTLPPATVAEKCLATAGALGGVYNGPCADPPQRSNGMTVEPEDVLEVWFEDAAADAASLARRYRVWFGSDAGFDDSIRRRFGDTHAALERGELDYWRETPRGRLAWLIVADQFSRNLHRGTARAFALDGAALACCLEGIRAGDDAELDAVEKMVFYMPLQHAEDVQAQQVAVERGEALMHDLPPGTRDLFTDALKYVRLHRDIIEKFGRFPHRNRALGRASTPEELDYLADDAPRFGQA